MNFFKDLKDEIENGTGELISDEDQLIDGILDEDFGDFDLSEEDSMGIDEELIAKMELEDSLMKEEERDKAEVMEEEQVVEELVEEAPVVVEEKVEEKVEEEVKEEVREEVAAPVEQGNPIDEVDSGKVTIISKGTVINGSIVSDGSLEVFGTVNGDISCLGKLSVTGAVKGKATGAEVYLNTNRIDGGIVSKGRVKVSVGTVVIGDISAASCEIAGAVKGDLDVNGTVMIDSTAVVKGNITSKGIQINNGAVIDGFCALPYSGVDIDSFFEEEEE